MATTTYWSYEQRFNTLYEAVLEGQDNWVDDDAGDKWFVQPDVYYPEVRWIAGAQHGVKASFGEGNGRDVERALDATTTEGIVYFAVRITNTDGSIVLYLKSAAAGNVAVWAGLRTSGNIEIGGGSVETALTGYNANQWYVCAIEYDCDNDQARLKVHNGTVWSAWTDWVAFLVASAGITYIKFEGLGGTGGSDVYFDTITMNDPTVAFIPKITVY